MQNFILPEFTDIVKKKTKKVPGKLSTVARAAGVSRSTMYQKMETGDFTIAQLKGMDTVLHFTEDEKQLIWR